MHLKQSFMKNWCFQALRVRNFELISSKRHQFFMKLLLQMYPKTFLEVVRRHPRYLEGPPTSGLYNAPTPMVIRPTNHFLFKKKVNPPQWLAVLETASLFFFHLVPKMAAPKKGMEKRLLFTLSHSLSH